jgi:predicted DNA-binding ribbon-helix-helix protein
MSVETALGNLESVSVTTLGDAEPLFRVVTTGARRRGVRLERVFWRLLDEIAERRNLKRSKLIQDVLNDDEGENVASTLRCFAANAIDAERRELEMQVSPQTMIGLMQQAPVPAFAINRQKRLQQVNTEFMQLLRPAPGVTGKTQGEYVHLSLDTPIEELFAVASSGQATQCNYSLQVDDRRRRGHAKMVLVPSARPDILVGYVLT